MKEPKKINCSLCTATINKRQSVLIKPKIRVCKSHTADEIEAFTIAIHATSNKGIDTFMTNVERGHFKQEILDAIVIKCGVNVWMEEYAFDINGAIILGYVSIHSDRKDDLSLFWKELREAHGYYY